MSAYKEVAKQEAENRLRKILFTKPKSSVFILQSGWEKLVKVFFGNK